jgi:hypothetical protein
MSALVEFSHGNVHKREWVHDGKTRSAYEYCFTFTKDGVTKRARGQAPTRDEAFEAMQARKDELAKEPEAPAPAVVTLGEYADRWIETIKSGVEPRTVESYAGMLKRHIRPTLGALPLPSITRGAVKDLLASKRASGLSKDSVPLDPRDGLRVVRRRDGPRAGDRQPGQQGRPWPWAQDAGRRDLVRAAAARQGDVHGAARHVPQVCRARPARRALAHARRHAAPGA